MLTLSATLLATQRQTTPPTPSVRLVVRDLWNRCEPTGAACNDCGAEDWASLPERMHYIAHLFRAYHLDAGLMTAPFTSAQVERFMSGIIPEGRL